MVISIENIQEVGHYSLSYAVRVQNRVHPPSPSSGTVRKKTHNKFQYLAFRQSRPFS